MITLTVNDKKIEAQEGNTILEALGKAEIYIPSLCSHPDLKCSEGANPIGAIYQGSRKLANAMAEKSFDGCGICVVEVDGSTEPLKACSTQVREGMKILTDTEKIKTERKRKLIPILSKHPHACLQCAQQEGCDRLQCSLNVPVEERCCELFGRCELQAVANYVGIDAATPRWIPTTFPIVKDEPLFNRNYNLCIGCLRCVRACNDLRGVEALGFVFDEKGNVHVGSMASTMSDSACRFCTACVEVCPTGALMDKNVRVGHEEEDLVPCRNHCSGDVNVPEYIRLIAAGKADEAHALIREKVPFPGILGRACIRPCEEACRRSEINEAIAICALKRYASDEEKGLWKAKSSILHDSGKRVAVIGSGPAGLTAAFYLKKRGHRVTIFEARDKPGGMLRYSIPLYKLPVEVVEKEIQDVLDTGVELKTGTRLGRDFSIEDLKKQGYDSIFIAIGAQLPRKLDIEGSDHEDVLWGIDFLYDIKEGRKIELKEKVVVIGGGNVACDVALTALRCGARDVAIACLEKREEMPADEWEIDRVTEEGVKIETGWGPNKILIKNGDLTGIELKGCPSVFGENGNFSPSYDSRRETLKADQVIIAIGQSAELDFIGKQVGIDTKGGLISVREATLETGILGVFAGGDVTKAPGAIIEAIQAGKNAASAIDTFLGGTGNIEENLYQPEPPSSHIGRIEGFASLSRVKIPEIPIAQRWESFTEIVEGYSAEQARQEAARCLQCDLRLMMGEITFPPSKWLAWTMENIDTVPEKEGVYRLLNAERKILEIKGAINMHDALKEAFESRNDVTCFDFVEDIFYSKRESELIQQYLQEHGEMPGGGSDDLDDLF